MRARTRHVREVVAASARRTLELSDRSCPPGTGLAAY